MIETTSLYEGQVEHILLANPPGNILDGAMLARLRMHLTSLHRPELKLVVFEGKGANFSFGASVEEHLPGQVEEMLPVFHDLFRDIEGLGVPTVAVVRGQCLGGGFELATWCGLVVCDLGARLGVPEVKVAVFPPIAAMALHWRVGGAVASRLVVTGETIDASEALGLGIADLCVGDATTAWRTWFETHLLPRSATAVRFAWLASRGPMRAALRDELPDLERLYLDELMSSHDAVEGLTAFVERREPVWRHT